MTFAVLDLGEFLSALPTASVGLPGLIHSTKGLNVYDILNAGQLETCECPVFQGEKLLYFFVGRPAYKPQDLPISDYWLTPIVFVFKNPLPLTPKRIFPFDSGAFAARRLGDEFADFDLSRFELGGDYEYIGKIIKVFFGSVGKYLRSEARQRDKVAKDYSIGPKGFSILALSSLLMKSATERYDDRNSVIEVQFDQPIPLEASNLKGIVLAEEWIADPQLEETLRAIGCTIETYPIFPLSRHAYYSKIYESCQRIDAS